MHFTRKLGQAFNLPFFIALST